jgi:ribosomal-protein-alanine N-acetyltransferase
VSAQAVGAGPELLIRPMEMEDLAAVVRNETRSYAFPWTPGQLADSIAGRDLCCVVQEAGAIVGHGIVSHGAGEAHLLNVCITRDRQGRGYGRVLLDFLVEDLRAREVRTIFLEVRPSNHAAIRLYETAGFVEIGLRPNYYPAATGHEDARVMAMELLDP